MEHCPNGSGELKVIAAVLQQPGNREDPDVSGSTGQSAAARASPCVAAASGLTASSPCQPGDSDAGAAGAGCARASHRRGLAPHCPGRHQGKDHQRHRSGLRSIFNRLRPAPAAAWNSDESSAGGVLGAKRAFEFPVLSIHNGCDCYSCRHSNAVSGQQNRAAKEIAQ